MYEDDPQDTVFDVLGTAVFGEHPLGRAIIGRAPVIRDTPVEQIARVPRRALRAELDRRRGRRLGRPRRGGRAGRAHARRPARGRERPAARRGARRTRRRRCASRARTPSRCTSASAPSASRAGTSAASRCACSTRSSAGCPRRGCSRPCARSAGSPTPSTRSPASSPTRARSACTSARGRTTWPPRWSVVGAELARLREEPATEEELHRARENVKARVVLAMESSAARMNRLGGSVLYELPLLELDEIMARIDAVELVGPARAGRRAVGAEPPVGGGHRPGRGRVPRRRGGRLSRGHGGRRGMIRVAVAGAAGRLGQTVCAAVEAAEDLELTGRADPALGTPLAAVLGAADVVVDFTRPDTAVANAREAVQAGVHAVVGHDRLRPRGAARGGRGGERRTSSWRRTSRSAPC